MTSSTSKPPVTKHRSLSCKKKYTRLESTLHHYLIPNPHVQRMLWIPGIGKVNALTIYTEIDGIELPDGQICTMCSLQIGFYLTADDRGCAVWCRAQRSL